MFNKSKLQNHAKAMNSASTLPALYLPWKIYFLGTQLKRTNVAWQTKPRKLEHFRTPLLLNSERIRISFCQNNHKQFILVSLTWLRYTLIQTCFHNLRSKRCTIEISNTIIILLLLRPLVQLQLFVPSHYLKRSRYLVWIVFSGVCHSFWTCI